MPPQICLKTKLENIKRLERVYVIIIYGMLKGAIFKILFSPFVANKLLLFFFLKKSLFSNFLFLMYQISFVFHIYCKAIHSNYIDFI